MSFTYLVFYACSYAIMFMVLGTAIHLIKAIFKGYQPMEQYTFELYGAVGAFVGIILYMVRV